MQLSVLFTALVSFVILAAASPAAPGAISKRSFKRENLDINFERDLLKTDLDDSDQPYKREELMDGLDDYDQPDKREELMDGLDDYDQPDKKRAL
ncbi:uncharacterized protein F5147DRAFT_774842 [Suillus discolor]|uniref:Uncharacterized protein n=1 Tax=Suillus discolor TaxID=1912936 RepID=A0A9P7F5G0_9AGAM|nr:uncharacterized protein F5147DRAFT_774842 [Suillus discolor]KAG2106562.1 hypothetical protein F5147DRAFT_774842 [Suillus discolor]